MGHWKEKQLAKGHLAGQWQNGDRALLALSALCPHCPLTLVIFHHKSRKFLYPKQMQLLGTARAFPYQ